MASNGGVLAFGDFEFDPRRHELRRAGQRVSLQDRPYQILECLLERPDEVVTRDELRSRLWPPDVHVEFEKSIAVAVMKLREALGDSAEEPRFIATLPRLGYRFIAPVQKRPPAQLQGDEPPQAGAVAPGPVERRGPRHRIAAGTALVGAALVLAYATWRMGEGRAPRIRSLAVLPFVDLSPRAGEEYLAAGLTEELITGLAQIGGLRVTSNTSSSALSGSKDSLPEQARRLGVDAVVRGSVQRVGTRVRVTAQLVHGATDRHLWAARYEREESDLLAFQNEIARDIVREIAVSLGPHEESRLARLRAADPEAYREYLKARFHRNRRSVDGYVQALRHFKRAIAIAPDFAEAHAGLGLVYFEMGVLGILVSDDAHTRALEETEQALQLDPELPVAHAVRGFVLVHREHRWQEAEVEFRRTRELGPSTDLIQLWVVHAAQGRHREALAEGERMLQLDPLNPLACEAVAYVLYLARQFDQAIAQYGSTLEIDADRQGALQGLGNSHAAAGHPEAALAAYVRWAQAAGLTADQVEGLRGRFAAEGLAGIWRFLLSLEQRDEQETGEVWPYRRATLHARLGEADAAFHWLDVALAEETTNLVYIGSEPVFDRLRGDPRFSDYLRRLNLDPRAFPATAAQTNKPEGLGSPAPAQRKQVHSIERP